MCFFSDDLWENCNNARIFLDRKVRFFATFAGMVVLYNPLIFFRWTALGMSVCPSHFDFTFEFQSGMPCDGRTDRNTITQIFDKQWTTY